MLSVGIVPIHESTYGDVDGYNAASMLAPSTTKKQSNAYLLMRHRSASTEISMLVGSDKRERSAMPTIKIRIMLYGNLDASRIRQEREKRYAYHQDPNNALRRSLDQ
jgi:hypothetical protein